MAASKSKKAKKPEPKKRGRPSDYNQAIADAICERLADGESLRKICREDESMPGIATVFRWLNVHSDFQEQYTRAREEQAETLADEIVGIADDGLNDTYIDENGMRRTDTDVIARSKLRVEARKWVASKLKPKRYGDKIVQEVTGADGGPQVHKVDVSLSPDEAYLRMIGK